MSSSFAWSSDNQVIIFHSGSMAARITFHGSGGSGKSYNLKGGCNGASNNYGVGVVDFYGDADTKSPTGQWTVTADIPDCPKEFRWKWEETGKNSEEFQDNSHGGHRHIPKDDLDRPYAVVYSILGTHGEAPIRKCL